MNQLIPTARLRFVERAVSLDAENSATVKILQQYWAEDMPGYMRDLAKGEWRDVECVMGEP
jgi:hypothetical protein